VLDSNSPVSRFKDAVRYNIDQYKKGHLVSHDFWIVGKGFLQFKELGIYITANKGYEFLWLNSKDNNKQQDSGNNKT
jgi:hypothetical protein